MSFLGQSALGVDATDGTLKAVKLVRRGRRVRLVGSWRIPYHRQADRLSGALEALRSFADTVRPDGLTSVVVAAPDHRHFSSTYLVPNMERARLSEMVRYEVLSQLGVPAEEALVRFHARKGVAEQQVHAVAFDRLQIEGFEESLRAQHFPFDEIQPPGYALASFVEHEHPLGRDRILLGVGETASELVLLREDGVWTRHLPFGLRAESSPARLAERLASEVGAAVAYQLPGDIPFRPADLVLTEEGALSAALTTELGRAMALPITRFGELPHISTSKHLGRGSATEPQTLAMGKALGLALTGLGLARLPCPLVKGNPRRAAARMLPMAGISLGVASLGLFGLTLLASQRAEALSAALAHDLPGEMQSLYRRSQETRAELGALQARADDLFALAGRRPAVLGMRAALARLAEVLATRGSDAMHVNSAYLAVGDATHPARLTITLDTDPVRDETLGSLLTETFRGVFANVAVSGPVEAPSPNLSRWVMEITLP